MIGFKEEIFARWLKANSLGGTGMRTEEEQRKLASSFGGEASAGEPVVLNSILVGSRAQEALQLDAAYSTALGSEAVAKLQESPATGCTMLLTLAREQSGYDPTLPAQAGSATKFLAYVQQVLVCPLFSVILNDHITPGFSGDWNSVIDQMVTYFPQIPEEDLTVLKNGLYEIAAAASSSPATNETLNMFSQATLIVDVEIDVCMYQTTVQMKTTVHTGGKHEPDTVSNQASLSLYRVHLRFNSAEWPGQAEDVHKQCQQSLDDWLANNATPVGSLSADWRPRSYISAERLARTTR